MPQTAEHLAAAHLMNLTHYAVIQNKVDQVSLNEAKSSHQQICSFLKGTRAENSPVIPVSAQMGCNVDSVCQYIVEQIPDPDHDLSLPPILNVLRSFDVNKPGTPLEELKGAVMGGVLERGLLELGQSVEIRPGQILLQGGQERRYFKPLRTKVVSLQSDTNNLPYATPGGLIGIGTLLDPSLAKNDGLVGQVVGLEGAMPDVFEKVEVKYRLFHRVMGTNDGESMAGFTTREKVLLHVGGNSAVGLVAAVQKKARLISIHLTGMPICARAEQRVAISRHAGKDHWRLVGFGRLTRASVPMPQLPDLASLQQQVSQN